MKTGRRAPPPPDIDARFDEQSRAAASDDFGHIAHGTPHCVVLPASDRDVVTAIRWAGGQHRKVAARGQGHSVFGRAQARDGVVIDMSHLRNVHSVQGGDRVVVDAGAKWSEVLAATLSHGLAPPVLTDYLQLSVGGTLVVGGVGGTSSRFGLQSDNVLELDVVTSSGEKLSCSPTSNTELFDVLRAGLGQVGIITRATLKLVPAPQQVRRFVLIYPDLKAMLKDERLLNADDRFDAVQGAVLATPTGWMFRLDAVKYSGNAADDNALLAGLSDERPQAQRSTLPYFDYLNRLAALEQALRANGQWFFPHPWLATFVGDSSVESVVSGELARSTPAELGPFGQIVLSPIRRQAVTSPLLRMPADKLCYAFNLIRIPATDSSAEACGLVHANRAVYERVRAAGGTLYPVSAVAMSAEDWRAHFGPVFDRLRDAKRSFDPGNVLAPGYDVDSDILNIVSG